MEEIELSSGEDKSSEELDEEKLEDSDYANNNDNTKNSHKSTVEQHYPWWKGGGIIPQSGRELGVFEQSLEDRANCFELWWMSYLNPLLALGSRKVLDSEDVGVPSEQD